MITVVLLSLSYVLPFDDCSEQSPCYVTAYFDTDPNSDTARDYSCGSHSYNNHRGTDFGIGSFPQMDLGRRVVAAASGVVEQVHDGEEDRCTSGRCPGGGGYGNHVRIAHPDGRLSIYAHLRKDSLRVAVGEEVGCGDPIGEVGSSGYSTGPHLHFEVRSGGERHDPFAGECGAGESAWDDQGVYQQLPGAICSTPPNVDAGSAPDAAGHRDVGTPDGSSPDSGPTPDAGPTPNGENDDVGCGCNGGSWPGTAACWVLLLVLRRRYFIAALN
jgi:murein DD-endopeptidase MepM/ murein hydrolase activator NlpD